MKKYLFAISLFFAFTRCLNAQVSDSLINDDAILSKIIKSIPKGWVFEVKDGAFIFRKSDSVIIASKKLLNYPMSKKIPIDTIIKYGTKTTSYISYKYDKRWTTEQTMAAYSNNTKIYQKLKALPTKYELLSLYDKTLSTRGHVVYTGKTEEEKKRVKKFEEERAGLLSKITLLPNYHTDYFSLFLIKSNGCNDDDICVAPDNASIQLYEILALMQDFTEKSQVQ